MLLDLDAAQGEWFYFFSSHIDASTGETVYEEPVKDARVQIRSIAPFIEERMGKRKKSFEHIYNPKTRSMERMSFFPEQTTEELKAERDDLWDYAIVAIEGFKDSKTGKAITATRESKLALMKLPVFDRFVARCQQLLSSAGVKEQDAQIKNS